MVMTVGKDRDEQELVSRIKSGDRAGFKILVDRFSTRVVNLCFRITGNRMDAEDIAQDVFVEIYKNIGKFRAESSLATWILRIAYNRALNHLRDNRRTQMLSLDSREVGEGRSFAETLQGKSSERPDREMEIRRNRSILYDAIAALPPKYGKPFALHKLDGMPYSDIANLLGISLSAVESRIHRAKLRLQKHLIKTMGQQKNNASLRTQ